MTRDKAPKKTSSKLAAKQQQKQLHNFNADGMIGLIYNQLEEYFKQINDLLAQKNKYSDALNLYQGTPKDLISNIPKFCHSVGISVRPDFLRDLSQIKAKLFTLMPLNYREQEIDHVLEVLNIDLADWVYLRPAYGNAPGVDPNQNFEFTATNIIIDRLHHIWSEGQEQEARDLFEYFVNKGFRANVLQARNNVLLYSILQYSDSPEFIQMLLDSGHIRINSVITSRTDDFRARTAPDIDLTAFNCAAAKLQTDFDKFKTIVLLLLENGADISSKGKRGLEHFKKMLQSPKKSKTKEDAAGINEFFKQLDEIISEFYLSKLKKLQESSPEEQVVEADATAQMAAEESEIAPVVTMAASSADELLTEYADFKEELSRDTDLPQETRTKYALEALFLNYIQTKDEATKAQINDLLVQNHSDEARKFYNQILLEVVSSDKHVGEVFTSQDLTQNYFELVKKLLHFQPQTAHLVSVVEEEAQEMILAEGVYKIEDAERIFISVAQDLLNSLAENQRTTIETFLQNPKFIGAKSKAKNGIKHYANDTYKLKTAKTDIGLVATRSYVDDEGNTLIIFDQICSHKELSRADASGLKTKLSDISDMIFAPCSSESAGSDSEHSSDVPPPPPIEPYPDGSGSAMFSEETSSLLVGDLVGDAAYYPE